MINHSGVSMSAMRVASEIAITTNKKAKNARTA